MREWVSARQGSGTPPPPLFPWGAVPTSEHGLLLLGRTDETADAPDDLALGVHLALTGLLAQKDGGHWGGAGKRARRM